MFIKAKRWGIVTDELDLDHLLWLTRTYFIKSNMRIIVSTTCFLKSARLCPIILAYVADQPDMSHLEKIIVNC